MFRESTASYLQESFAEREKTFPHKCKNKIFINGLTCWEQRLFFGWFPLQAEPEWTYKKLVTVLQGSYPETGFRIRIRIRIRIHMDPHKFELLDPDPDPHTNCGSGSRRAKMTQKNRKKDRIFIFWSAGCSLWGLKASPVAWASFMEA
jgi:hypothetical protein